jgi:hypothetical protein
LEKEQRDLTHGRTSLREAVAKFPQIFRKIALVSKHDHLIFVAITACRARPAFSPKNGGSFPFPRHSC